MLLSLHPSIVQIGAFPPFIRTPHSSCPLAPVLCSSFLCSLVRLHLSSSFRPFPSHTALPLSLSSLSHSLAFFPFLGTGTPLFPRYTQFIQISCVSSHAPYISHYWGRFVFPCSHLSSFKSAFLSPPRPFSVPGINRLIICIHFTQRMQVSGHQRKESTDVAGLFLVRLCCALVVYAHAVPRAIRLFCWVVFLGIFVGPRSPTVNASAFEPLFY